MSVLNDGAVYGVTEGVSAEPGGGVTGSGDGVTGPTVGVGDGFGALRSATTVLIEANQLRSCCVPAVMGSMVGSTS